MRLQQLIELAILDAMGLLDEDEQRSFQREHSGYLRMGLVAADHDSGRNPADIEDREFLARVGEPGFQGSDLDFAIGA